MTAPIKNQYVKTNTGTLIAENDQGDVTEISLFGIKDGRSILNLLPEKAREMARNLDPKWLLMDEDKLEKACHPSSVDRQLRISFWMRYEEAQDTNRRAINIKKVYKGICTPDYFYNVVCAIPEKMSWMLRMRSSYNYSMEEILDLGVAQFKEIMALPNKVGGRVDTRLIAEKVKIFAIVDNRVKGAVTQRMQIEQKNLNVNVQASGNTVGDVQKELRAVDKEIKDLQIAARKEVLQIEKDVDIKSLIETGSVSRSGEAPREITGSSGEEADSEEEQSEHTKEPSSQESI